MSVPKTIICDIDGVIFEHEGKGAVDQWARGKSKLLPNVTETFNKWEKAGFTIILMTARKESCRGDLEADLRECGLFWDHLIMGVSHGQRFLINDKKADSDEASAYAFTIKRNQGL